MLRSTLEKTLRDSGYRKGSLAERIDQAEADGVMTAARSKRAHEDIRVLGNDVLHDEWREVSEDEFEEACRYDNSLAPNIWEPSRMTALSFGGWTISLFSTKPICVEFYPRTSPITIAGDRIARWARQFHAARQDPSLGRHADRSSRNLCLADYTT